MKMIQLLLESARTYDEDCNNQPFEIEPRRGRDEARCRPGEVAPEVPRRLPARFREAARSMHSARGRRGRGSTSPQRSRPRQRTTRFPEPASEPQQTA
jgi:hypothetical protein